MFLSNSEGGEEVVEDLEWDREGKCLVVNLMKRYVMVLSIEKEGFGRELSKSEHTALIEDSFGAQSAAVLARQDLEIFNPQAAPTEP